MYVKWYTFHTNSFNFLKKEEEEKKIMFRANNSRRGCDKKMSKTSAYIVIHAILFRFYYYFFGFCLIFRILINVSILYISFSIIFFFKIRIVFFWFQYFKTINAILLSYRSNIYINSKIVKLIIIKWKRRIVDAWKRW